MTDEVPAADDRRTWAWVSFALTAVTAVVLGIADYMILSDTGESTDSWFRTAVGLSVVALLLAGLAIAVGVGAMHRPARTRRDTVAFVLACVVVPANIVVYLAILFS
ncbi:hypothetical protein [Frondihabitans australicus]|uniref:Uncharacterized protein n=1 Tax=Frondihabitans australicus TaxID=386892 RepID=A0A495IH46_9MICO|nr:hypothetical protein [Frondihabitans australicus]RKR74641.1 hypothetical protein C8E83_1765 [Frondihabitans australicus]